MKLVDLSHRIEDGLVTYRGLPAPVVCDYWSRDQNPVAMDDGSSFQIGEIKMVSNTGTYLDCPFHRYEDGKDTSEVILEKLVDLTAIKVTVDAQAVDTHHFLNKDVSGKAVLIHTNWSRHWNTETYYSNHPYLTEAAAHYLKTRGALLVGIDSYNIDNTGENRRPVHSILLKEEILIVEHLCNLAGLPEEGFTFSAVPPKIKGMGTFPVRAYAKVGD